MLALLAGAGAVRAQNQSQDPAQQIDESAGPQVASPAGEEVSAENEASTGNPSGETGQTGTGEPEEPEGGVNTDTRGQPGHDSLAAGRKAKEEGRLRRAELHFKNALSRARRGGDVYWSALEELTFRLPLARADGLAAVNRFQEAIKVLENLLVEQDPDGNKSRYLLHLIAELENQASTRGVNRGRSPDGREVIDEIEETLDKFLAENGRYPRNYKELNEILPADEDPLTAFDIVDYEGGTAAYGLTIRSKTNPDNRLSVRKTGLVQ